MHGDHEQDKEDGSEQACQGLGNYGNKYRIPFLCCLRSIAAHKDCPVSVCLSVRLSGSHTFLVVTHSYVSQATHAFLRMLPLCCFSLSLKVNNVHFSVCQSKIFDFVSMIISYT